MNAFQVLPDLPFPRTRGEADSGSDAGMWLRISYKADALIAKEALIPERYRFQRKPRENGQSGGSTDRFHPNGTSETYRNRIPDFPIVMSAPEPSETFVVHQKWEGYVTKVEKTRFWANLTVLKGEGPEQIAELEFDEIPRDDHCLVVPGGVFYWSIGYLRKTSGTIMRASEIRFRRLPPLNKDQIRKIEMKADRLGQLFEDE
jgi:hypothetical protein